MIRISETTIDNQIGFRINNEETGEILTISFTVHRIRYEEKEFILLYDNKMKPIESAFNFLNFYLSDKAKHTRYKAAQALRLLYSYQVIVRKEMAHFEQSDFNNLKSFLHGYSTHGNILKTKLITSRSNSTINSYLSVYRQYLEFLGESNVAINKINSVFHYYDPTREQLYQGAEYQISERVATPIEVPKYISIDEFKETIGIIRSNYTLREEVIVRLMYESGLRIGEVLGLTLEDMDIVEEEGEYICLLYIRNRYSDQSFQSAKGCMKIINKKQYQQKDYKLRDAGFQLVVISQDLYETIDEYIEQAHSKARVMYEDNYCENNRADNVIQGSSNENFYLFINSLGRPLSQANWNQTLRRIFKESNIHVDTQQRKHNLNHRFRHGFAMFQVQYMQCDELELKERMRHRSLQSVTTYFNPTIKDQVRVKKELATTLYELYPNLKLGGN